MSARPARRPAAGPGGFSPAAVTVVSAGMPLLDQAVTAWSWGTVEKEHASLTGWAVEHATELDELCDRIRIGNERRATALREKAPAETVAKIERRIAELRQQALGLDGNARLLLATRAALYVRDLLGACELWIRADPVDGVATELRVTTAPIEASA